MKCPKCNAKLKTVMVAVEGAKSKAKSYQCPKCAYFKLEDKTTKKVIGELREEHINLKQKAVKLSHNRLDMYLNKNIISSLELKAGRGITVTVPNKKHILISIEN